MQSALSAPPIILHACFRDRVIVAFLAVGVRRPSTTHLFVTETKSDHEQPQMLTQIDRKDTDCDVVCQWQCCARITTHTGMKLELSAIPLQISLWFSGIITVLAFAS